MPIIGVDVSKNKLDCALLADPQGPKYKTKVVPNDLRGFETLISWGCRQGDCEPAQLHLVMEATGVYHEAAALAFHRAGSQVSVVNPAQLRDFAKGLAMKSKTDASDRAVLARYGHLVKPALWQPPPAEVLELKALVRRLGTIETDIRRELNRVEKVQLSAAPSTVHDSLQTSLKFLRDEKARIEKSIDEHIDRHPQLKHDRELLESIPAVGRKTAWRMLAVIHSRPFRTAAQLAAYLGLVPIEHCSGTSVYKRPRLSKAGDARIRATLYMAAVVAIRFNPDIHAQYQRLLENGKSKMSALGAAMRKLVHICFGVVKNQTAYTPQCTCGA